MTNDFLYPSNSKIDEKEPRYNEQNNFASPLALRHAEVPPPVLTEDTVFTSRTGEGARGDQKFYVIGATQGKGNTDT